MKKILSNIYTLAALCMMGAATFTACSSDDAVVEQAPEQPADKTYTLTVQASKEMGTRMLTPGTDEVTGKPTINATWKTDENVYVMKVVESATRAGAPTGVKTVTWADGSLSPQAVGTTATLTGTISGFDIAEGDVLTLQFPRSGNGAIDLDYSGQDGTLETIASDYDYATAKITVTNVDKDGNITTENGTVDFSNQQAIVRFTLLDKAGNAIIPTALTVYPAAAMASYLNDATLITATNILTITPSKNTNAATDDNTNVIYAALRGVKERDFTLTATVGDDTYTYEKSGVTFTHGQFYDIAVKMTHTPKTYNLAEATGDVTLRDGDTATGEMTGHTLYIADGATVTLSGASVTGSNNGAIRCEGDATILLADGTENTAKAKAYGNFSAVHWPSGKKLTISGGTAGTGKLIAEGSSSSSYSYGAGIGGGSGHPCGDLSITGGVITATGGGQAAGIGAASGGHCGKITISGGNVTATSSDHGAGIGAANTSEYSNCGAILISGGTVTATGKGNSAGIGYAGSSSATSVTITGDIISVKAKRGGNINGPCICTSAYNGSAIIDSEIIDSNYFKDDYEGGLPEFTHLNLEERDNYKDAEIWILTHK